jgi:hypothetical protein
MHQFMGMWLNPNSRGSRLRIWQPWGCNSLHAHQPSLEAQARAGLPRRSSERRRATPSTQASLGPAGHFTATGFSGNSRPRRLKIAEPSGCFAVRDSEPSRLGHPSRKTWEGHSRVADQPSLVEIRPGKPACGSPGIADQFDSRSNSLGSASLPTPTNLECQPDERAGPVC